MTPAGDVKDGVIQSPGPYVCQPAWVRTAHRSTGPGGSGWMARVDEHDNAIYWRRADARLCAELGLPAGSAGRVVVVKEDRFFFVTGYISDEAP